MDFINQPISELISPMLNKLYFLFGCLSAMMLGMIGFIKLIYLQLFLHGSPVLLYIASTDYYVFLF